MLDHWELASVGAASSVGSARWGLVLVRVWRVPCSTPPTAANDNVGNMNKSIWTKTGQIEVGSSILHFAEAAISINNVVEDSMISLCILVRLS